MNKPISKKIYELRKARALTQEKLGEQLGVSSQAVSKWEKGESLPDILILSKLCQTLGISVDSLLELPLSAKKENCMESLGSYAREVGGVASFEAIQSCAKATDNKMNSGSAFMSNDGVRVCTEKGIGIVIHSEKQLKKIINTEMDSIKKICDILGDENIVKIIQSLDFAFSYNSTEIAEKSGLTKEEVELSLFKLMKFDFCNCDNMEKYSFGGHSYNLVTILCGIYLSSPDGLKEVNSITRSYHSPK